MYLHVHTLQGYKSHDVGFAKLSEIEGKKNWAGIVWWTEIERLQNLVAEERSRGEKKEKWGDLNHLIKANHLWKR